MRRQLVAGEVVSDARAVMSASADTDANPDPTRSRAEPITIFVVDDDPVLLTLIARSLTLSGYRVFEAESGSEALDLARRYTRSVDLLLTDVVMPGMDGFEVAEAFSHLHPEAKVLYMSGHVDDVPAVRQRFDAHRSMFLVKPFWFEALLEKIQSILPD